MAGLRITAAFTAAVLLIIPCVLRAAPDPADAPSPVDLGVELEFELSGPGSDASEADTHFQLDTLYLYPTIELSPQTEFSADIAVKDDTAYVEEAWLRWAASERFWVKAGLDDPVIANVDRKTEAEILLETAFYRSDELGVQIGGAIVPRLEWWASATNGSELAEKGPSEDGGFPLVHDGRRLDAAAGSLMYGAGLQLHGSLGPGEGSVMPWVYNGSLNEADVGFLQTISGYGSSIEDRKQRWGVNGNWRSGRLTVLGQVMEGRDGDLERRGLFVQPSWRLNDRFEVAYRYNRLKTDLPAVAADSRTWDRTQHVLALLASLADGVVLKTEYYVNGEDTGGASVDNDELLLQLQVSWPP